MSQSLSVLPYFDENNYAYQKIKMRVWASIEKGQKAPSTSITSVVTPIDISTQTKDDQLSVVEIAWMSMPYLWHQP